MDMNAIKEAACVLMGVKSSHPFKEPGNKYYHGERVAALALRLRRRIIPDAWLFPFMLIGLIVGAFFPWISTPGDSAIAAAAGYGLGVLMGWMFELRAKSLELKAKKIDKSSNRNRTLSSNGAAIGLGDVKLLAAGGIWLGTTGLAIAIIISCILGGAWGIVRRQKYIPFAPFFLAGLVAAILILLLL